MQKKIILSILLLFFIHVAEAIILVINPKNSQLGIYTTGTGESFVYSSLLIQIISSNQIKTTENNNVVSINGLYYIRVIPIIKSERLELLDSLESKEIKKQFLVFKKNTNGGTSRIKNITTTFLEKLKALILQGFLTIQIHSDVYHQNSPTTIAAYLLGIDYEKISEQKKMIEIKEFIHTSITKHTHINFEYFDFIFVKIGALIQFSIIPLDEQICMLIKAEQIEFLLMKDVHELIRSSASGVTWYGFSYNPNRAKNTQIILGLLPYYIESFREYLFKLAIPRWNWYFPGNPKHQVWKIPAFWKPAELKAPAKDCSYIK